MPLPSSDDSRPDTVNNSNGSRRLSQEITNLQREIRVDFDQKLKELSGLMHKFKSLLANDRQLSGNLSHAANDANLDEEKDSNVVDLFSDKDNDAASIPILTDRVTDTACEPNTVPEANENLVDINCGNEQDKDTDTQPQEIPVSRFATEPARFESGLYQLNCQLYRFKLELDQEMEFREEPLHIHFQNQSELSGVLRQITEKSNQERNTGS